MKSLINYALLKEQLKRFWAIAALSVLGYVLFIILPIYGMRYSDYTIGHELISIFAMKNPVLIAASVAVPLFTVLVTCSYLFQSKSATAMHAYPINKNQLYFTNMLTGLIIFSVPLLILSLVLLTPVNLHDFDINNGLVINTLPAVALHFLRTLLTFVFYYALFLLAAMLSGNSIIYVLVCGALPFIPTGLYLLVQSIGYYYCFGYDMNSTLHWVQNLLLYANPVLLAIVLETGAAWPYVLSYVLIGTVLFASGFWLNRIRRQERAGDSIVFSPIKNVLIFLLSLLGMILLGIFFLAMFQGIIYMYAGFVLGFIIAYFIAQMIAEKSFNVFLSKAKDLVKFGGVMACLFLIVIAVTKFDLIGYSSYSPNPDDIAGVYLSYPYSSYNGRRAMDYDENFFISDPSIISDSAAIQKQMVDRRDEFRGVFLENLAGKWYNGKYGRITNQYFTFRLKSGGIITRSYMLPESFAEESGLNNLLLREEVILAPYYSFKSPERIGGIVLDYYNYEEEVNYTIRIERPEHVISALEEIKKDIIIWERERRKSYEEALKEAEGSIANSAQTKAEDMPVPVPAPPSISGHVELKGEGYYRWYDWFNLDITENTGEWLLNNGYEWIKN